MITESTASELRETGISVLGGVRWGTHFCCFYETKEDLLDTLVAYFKAGLENKEFCVWVVPQALTVEEARRALGQAVPNLERHLAEGALEIHSHEEWYLRNGRWDSHRVLQAWREKISRTSVNGYGGLRGSGDGGWVQNEDWMAFREYEKQVNALIADQRSIILCTYPLAASPGDQIFDVAHIHEVAVARRNGTWETIEIPALKEAKAEISKLNEELEEKVEERTKELAATNEALRAEIAERKLAEAAVKQAEDRIRLVIDTIPTMAWTLQPDGVVDFVNQRWLDYTGLSLEEALEDSKQIVHPEDLPRAVAKWLPTMAAGAPGEDEMRMRRADGRYRWFLVRTAPLLDEQGNILKWYGVSIDIEDRKRAETQSRVLIDAIPQQIWSAPPDGKTDYCNDRWRSYTGLRLEDLRGYGWQTMIHPDDRDRVLKAWQQSVVNGTPYEQEERHRGADGTYRWFLSLGVPLRDAEGRIVRWYGTNTDIEDRKRAEEALRKSEKLFAAFMDHLPGFAWMKDIEGRYVFVNKKEAELDVYRDGAIGKTDAELWPEEIASAYRANDQQVITTRKEVQTVEPSLANGEKSYMLVSKFPVFDQDGAVVMVAGAGVDITDLTEAKDALNAQALRYKTLMATSTDSIYVLDDKGNLQEANAAFLHGRGYTAAEVKGLNVADWDAMWGREQLQERRLKLVDRSHVFESRHRRKDGSVFDVEVCATGVRIGGEQFVFCVTRDITERTQAAKELGEANRQLRILSRQLFQIQEEERRHLARELHDEIGQTLTAAMINLKIIAPDVPAQVTGRLDDSIQLLDRLLRQVRELSLDLRPPLLDELGLAPTLRWLVDQQGQRAGLRVSFIANVNGLEIDPAVQTTCFRVAQEAITNIIRHAEAKSVAVEVRREAERLWLIVRDDGKGFDPAAIQQKLTQHSTLGLVSMRERALLVRGGLEIRSAPGQGAEIRAWFPLPNGEPSFSTQTS
jgi:PAS domain S-box-containing protein